MDASTHTVSPLRQRMIEDMCMRRMQDRTQEAYIRGVRRLARFLEGLSGPGTHPLQDDDAHRRRVHAPLPAARAAHRLAPYPPLRAARQHRSQKQPHRRPRSSAAARLRTGCTACRRQTVAATADVHLWALRSTDDHRRVARTSASHPRAARAARHAMTIVAACTAVAAPARLANARAGPRLACCVKHLSAIGIAIPKADMRWPAKPPSAPRASASCPPSSPAPTPPSLKPP